MPSLSLYRKALKVASSSTRAAAVPAPVAKPAVKLCGVIEVGDLAPDFALRVQSGETVRLSELLAANGAVVLAFYLLDFSGG